MSQYQTKLWGARFEQSPTHDVIAFSTSIGIDWRLWEADIDGSVAHVLMLGDQNIIPKPEATVIRDGLKTVQKQIATVLASGENPIC